MHLKKIGNRILFPPVPLLLLLLPAATAFLIYAMFTRQTDDPIAIASYVLAAYTLTVWCLRLPTLLRAYRIFRQENRYWKRWREDTRLRVCFSLYGGLVWNAAYAALQMGLGFYHESFWFHSIAGYYLCLAVMRYLLARYTARYQPGENRQKELSAYRACGWTLLLMNLALALMVFFMVYWNRTFRHHPITAIAMAAYTFGSLAMAIVNAVKYKKYNSPAYSAARTVSLAAACVSMLTLESTMLTAFGDGTMTALTKQILQGATGGAVSLFIIFMAIRMIVRGTKQRKETIDYGR